MGAVEAKCGREERAGPLVARHGDREARPHGLCERLSQALRQPEHMACEADGDKRKRNLDQEADERDGADRGQARSRCIACENGLDRSVTDESDNRDEAEKPE